MAFGTHLLGGTGLRLTRGPHSCPLKELCSALQGCVVRVVLRCVKALPSLSSQRVSKGTCWSHTAFPVACLLERLITLCLQLTGGTSKCGCFRKSRKNRVLGKTNQPMQSSFFVCFVIHYLAAVWVGALGCWGIQWGILVQEEAEPHLRDHSLRPALQKWPEPARE